MTSFASMQRDSSFGPNSAYSSIQGVKIVVNGMIMMLVVILEDRLGIGQENIRPNNQFIRYNQLMYRNPHDFPNLFTPD